MKPSSPPTTYTAPPGGGEIPDKCELGGLGEHRTAGRGACQHLKRKEHHAILSPQPFAPSLALTPAMSEQIALEKTDRSQEPRFKAFFIAQQQMKLFTYT